MLALKNYGSDESGEDSSEEDITLHLKTSTAKISSSIVIASAPGVIPSVSCFNIALYEQLTFSKYQLKMRIYVYLFPCLYAYEYMCIQVRRYSCLCVYHTISVRMHMCEC